MMSYFAQLAYEVILVLWRHNERVVGEAYLESVE